MTDESPAPVAIGIVAGDPTPEELAAVTAVVTASLDELAAESERAVTVTAWQRSQRGLRATIHPGNGIWRSFSA